MEMNLVIEYNPTNLLTSWDTVSFSRRTVILGVSAERTSRTYIIVCTVR